MGLAFSGSSVDSLNRPSGRKQRRDLELVVSGPSTNAVNASAGAGGSAPGCDSWLAPRCIALFLACDGGQVLVQVCEMTTRILRSRQGRMRTPRAVAGYSWWRHSARTGAGTCQRALTRGSGSGERSLSAERTSRLRVCVIVRFGDREGQRAVDARGIVDAPGLRLRGLDEIPVVVLVPVAVNCCSDNEP